MNYETAKELISGFKDIDAAFNKVLHQLSALDQSDEIKDLKRELCRVSLESYKGLVLPIAKQYPELDPDYEQKQSMKKG